ncbi:hypothetical protein HK098_004755 [Nowakowskiella sp. JEL0407]|nr:hypothetical protein HK098_004755 [Nowakowskiella sp. JEL0407]
MGTSPGWLLKDPSLVPAYALSFFVIFHFPGDIVYKFLTHPSVSPIYDPFIYNYFDSVSRATTASSYIDTWRRKVTEYHRATHVGIHTPRIPLLPQLFIGVVSSTFGGMWYRWFFIQPWTTPPYSFWVVCVCAAWYIWAIDPLCYAEPVIKFIGAIIKADSQFTTDIINSLKRAILIVSFAQQQSDEGVKTPDSMTAWVAGNMIPAKDAVVICAVVMFVGFVLKSSVLALWRALLDAADSLDSDQNRPSEQLTLEELQQYFLQSLNSDDDVVSEEIINAFEFTMESLITHGKLIKDESQNLFSVPIQYYENANETYPDSEEPAQGTSPWPGVFNMFTPPGTPSSPSPAGKSHNSAPKAKSGSNLKRDGRISKKSNGTHKKHSSLSPYQRIRFEFESLKETLESNDISIDNLLSNSTSIGTNSPPRSFSWPWNMMSPSKSSSDGEYEKYKQFVDKMKQKLVESNIPIPEFSFNDEDDESEAASDMEMGEIVETPEVVTPPEPSVASSSKKSKGKKAKAAASFAPEKLNGDTESIATTPPSKKKGKRSRQAAFVDEPIPAPQPPSTPSRDKDDYDESLTSKIETLERQLILEAASRSDLVKRLHEDAQLLEDRAKENRDIIRQVEERNLPSKRMRVSSTTDKDYAEISNKPQSPGKVPQKDMMNRLTNLRKILSFQEETTTKEQNELNTIVTELQVEKDQLLQRIKDIENMRVKEKKMMAKSLVVEVTPLKRELDAVRVLLAALQAERASWVDSDEDVVNYTEEDLKKLIMERVQFESDLHINRTEYVELLAASEKLSSSLKECEKEAQILSQSKNESDLLILHAEEEIAKFTASVNEKDRQLEVALDEVLQHRERENELSREMDLMVKEMETTQNRLSLILPKLEEIEGKRRTVAQSPSRGISSPAAKTKDIVDEWKAVVHEVDIITEQQRAVSEQLSRAKANKISAVTVLHEVESNLEWKQQELNSVNDDLANAQTKLKSLQQKRAIIQNKISELEGNVKAFEDDWSAKKLKAVGLQHTIAEIEDILVSLKFKAQKVKASLEKKREIEKVKHEQEQKRVDIEDKIKKYQQKVEQLNANIESLEEMASAANSSNQVDVANLHDVKRNLQNQVTERDSQIKELELRLTQLNGEKNRLLQHKGELEMLVSSLEKEASVKDAMVKDLQMEVATHQRDGKLLQKQVEKLNNSVGKLHDQLSSAQEAKKLAEQNLEKSMADMKMEISAKDERIYSIHEELQKAITEHELKFNKLTRSLSSSEMEKKELRLQIASHEEGILRLQAELSEVVEMRTQSQKEYEAAIEKLKNNLSITEQELATTAERLESTIAARTEEKQRLTYLLEEERGTKQSLKIQFEILTKKHHDTNRYLDEIRSQLSFTVRELEEAQAIHQSEINARNAEIRDLALQLNEEKENHQRDIDQLQESIDEKERESKVYLNRINVLNANMDEIHESIEAISQDRAKIKKEMEQGIGGLLDELNKRDAHLAELELSFQRKIVMMQKEHEELIMKNEKLRHQKEELLERIDRQSDKIDELEQNAKDLILEHEEAINKSEARVVVLEQELDTQAHQFNIAKHNLERSYSELKLENNNLDELSSTLKIELDLQVNRSSELELELKKLEQERDSIKQSRAALLSRHEAELAALQNQLTPKENTLRDLQNSLETAIAKHADEVSHLERELGIKDKEISRYVKRGAELEKIIQSMQQQHDVLEAERDHVRVEIGTISNRLQAEIDGRNADIQQLQREISDTLLAKREEGDKLRAQVEKIAVERNDIRLKMESLESQNIQLRKENEEEKVKLKATTIQLEKLQEETTDLIQEKLVVINDLKQELATIKANKDAELEKLRGQISERNLFVSGFRAQMSELEGQISKLENEKEEIQQKAKAEANKLRGEVAVLNNVINERLNEIKISEKEIEDLHGELAGKEKECETLQEHIGTLQGKIAAIEKKLMVVSAERDNMESEVLESRERVLSLQRSYEEKLKAGKNEIMAKQEELEAAAEKYAREIRKRDNTIRDLGLRIDRQHEELQRSEHVVLETKESHELTRAELETTAANLQVQIQNLKNELVALRTLQTETKKEAEQIETELQLQLTQKTHEVEQNQSAIQSLNYTIAQLEEKQEESANHRTALLRKHQEETQTLRAEISAFEQHLAQATADYQKIVNEKNAELESIHLELQQTSNNLADLSEQHKTAQQLVEEYRTKFESLKGDMSGVRNKLEDETALLRKQVIKSESGLRAVAAKLELEQESRREDQETFKLKLKERNDEIDTLKSRIKTLLDESSQMKRAHSAQVENYEGELSELRQQLHGSETISATQDASIIRLSEEIYLYKKKIETLMTELTEQKKESVALKQNNLEILEEKANYMKDLRNSRADLEKANTKLQTVEAKRASEGTKLKEIIERLKRKISDLSQQLHERTMQTEQLRASLLAATEWSSRADSNIKLMREEDRSWAKAQKAFDNEIDDLIKTIPEENGNPVDDEMAVDDEQSENGAEDDGEKPQEPAEQNVVINEGESAGFVNDEPQNEKARSLSPDLNPNPVPNTSEAAPTKSKGKGVKKQSKKHAAQQ